MVSRYSFPFVTDRLPAAFFLMWPGCGFFDEDFMVLREPVLIVLEVAENGIH